MPIKALIMDFDGVIVDSFRFHFEAWAACASKMFDTPISIEDLLSIEAKNPHQIAKAICQKFGSPSLAPALYEEKKRYLDTTQRVPEIYKGAYGLHKWVALNKIPWAIASNSSKTFLRRAAGFYQLNFDAILGMEDYREPKPSPEAFLLAAKKLGVPLGDHQHVFVIDDSTRCVRAAKKAGMKAIGVTTTQHKIKIESADPDYVTESINCSDLLYFLDTKLQA